MSHIIIRNRLDSGNLPSVAWSQVTYTGDVPRWLAQRRLHYDAVSGQVLTYSNIQSASGIYSTDMFALNPSTLVATRLGGTQSPQAGAVGNYPDSNVGAWNNGEGSDVQPWPSDRHPEFQSVIDTLRNRYWQWSGLAFGNPVSGDGLCYNDLWSYALNVDPTDNTWTLRGTEDPASVSTNGVLWYDSVTDLLILHGQVGNPKTWVYAPSVSLSAAQTTAGCTAPQTWSLTYSPVTNVPQYSYYANGVYATASQQVLLFSWNNSGLSDSMLEIWRYDVAAQTWTNRAPSGLPHQQQVTGHDWATSYVSSGRCVGSVWFHRTTHTASADTAEAADFLYEPSANVLTPLSVSGFGPSKIHMSEFVPSLGSDGGLIAHEGSTGQFWHGVLS